MNFLAYEIFSPYLFILQIYLHNLITIKKETEKKTNKSHIVLMVVFIR